MTEQELDFVAWMDNLDLEEVNLLDAAPDARDDYDARAQAKRAEDDDVKELPPQRGLGWDAS